jgi:AcrR family transcriptional regulator
MKARVRIQLPPREKRSRVERATETRERILAAVVESISEIGYPKTTANEIARRAGVSWGAVQHHFGDKDGILVAVLEESFNRFTQVVADLPDTGLSLPERVSLFIDRSWEHFGSAHYRSTFEILLNLPAELSWKRETLAAWIRIWSTFFPESAIPARETTDIMRYTVSVLSGLAATNMLEGEQSRSRESELGFLKDWLARKLADGVTRRS